MITKAHAKLLREKIVKGSKTLSDDEAYGVPELFNKWEDEKNYAVGDRVRYENDLYKCLTAHTSQSTWTPPDAPSLWVRIDDPSQEFPEWRQPTGATDAYAKGAKCSHPTPDRHWISNVDGNVWEPGIYGWDEVA